MKREEAAQKLISNEQKAEETLEALKSFTDHEDVSEQLFAAAERLDDLPIAGLYMTYGVYTRAVGICEELLEKSDG